MARLRTLAEAERIINETGTPPHDEHMMLNDGRILRTAEEVKAWLRSAATERRRAVAAG